MDDVEHASLSYCKINQQGAERFVLEGLAELLRRCAIHRLEIELFKDSEDCVELMQGYSFKLRSGSLYRLLVQP